MNWQAQRITELSEQVSQLTDTYVQNTQVHTSNLIFTHFEIDFRYKNKHKSLFCICRTSRDIRTYSKRASAEKTFQPKEKNLDA